MVKIEKSSDELNRFISLAGVSPVHAASFTGSDELCHTVKNHFPAVTRKEIRKWAESNLSYSLHKLSGKTSKKTRCKLLKFIVYRKLIWLLYKMSLKKMM